MSHDDDLDLFKEIMGDAKRIDHDTAEHQKVHRVTESHLAKRESTMWLSDGDKDYLSLHYTLLTNVQA